MGDPPNSIWNVESLKALMDERNIRYEVIANTAKEAVSLFRDNNEKWRESQNEWRKAMNDKDRNFVTKATMWGYAVGVVGFVVALLTIMGQFTVSR